MTRITRKIPYVGSIIMVLVLLTSLVAMNVTASVPNSTLINNVVMVTNPPHVTIKENTRTSQIVQVGDTLISIKADENHASAVMEIKNLTTKETQVLNYKITKSNGMYTTSVYNNGTLITTSVTNYDPFEPGATATLLNNSAKTVSGNAAQVVPMLQNGPHYFWDGVYFVGAHSPYVKYAHPDYDNYGIATWETCYINGNNLVHYHIDSSDSNTIAQLGPVAAGAAIGAYAGVGGAVVGAVLGLIMGNQLCNALIDENSCIWFWYAHNYEFKLFPLPPSYIYYVPSYFRIATYTLWDDIGQGNP